MNDNEIKVALSGQVDNDTRIIFTYPTPYDPVKSVSELWLKSIFDPREARNFAEAPKVYAFWSGPQGNYYGVIVPSPNDTRNGRLMVSLFTGKRLIRSGKILKEVLDALAKMLIEDPSSTSVNEISRLLSTLTVEPDRMGMKSMLNGKIGYREIANELALDIALSNCDQREYFKYRRILFVMSMYGSPVNPSDYIKITAPVIPFIPPKPTISPVAPQPATATPAPKPIVFERPKSKSTGKTIGYIIGSIIGLYIVFAAICGFIAGVVPPFDSAKSDEVVEAVQGDVIDNNATADEESLRQTDISYLKANDVWNHAELKSERYRGLVSLIKGGHIDKIMADEWFAGQAANGYWEQIVTFVQQNPSKKQEISEAFASSVEGDNVFLLRIKEKLDKISLPENTEVSPQVPDKSVSNNRVPKEVKAEKHPAPVVNNKPKIPNNPKPKKEVTPPTPKPTPAPGKAPEKMMDI